MDQRQEQLLSAIIEEYVRTAQAVSSHVLVDKLRLGVSSATIRNEMVEMEDAGLLEQPHTSAGRVPTERGFRYYLDHLAPGRALSRPTQQMLDAISRQYRDHDEQYMKKIARTVADLMHLAVIVGEPRSFVYYTGITNVLRQPEFADTHLTMRIGEIVDQLDEVLTDYVEQLTDEVSVLFGRDNPFSSACGTVIVRYGGQRHVGVFGILGPMRMDYPRARALVSYTVKELL